MVHRLEVGKLELNMRSKATQDDAVETKNDTDGFTSTVDGHGSRMPKLEKPVQPRKVAALCADLADVRLKNLVDSGSLIVAI
ncbi:hypothetical protein ERO13_D02G218533v2 [Gossypium hirsutum]|nr:hypothetical protein ERO13_D02G218533v2 [Gossypium hirsutum]